MSRTVSTRVSPRLKATLNRVMRLNKRQMTTNVQKVLHTLLTADGDGWVSGSAFRVPSATARIRELRTERYGGFNVECDSAANLGLRGGAHTFYYRVKPRSLTLTRLERVFGGVVETQ